MLSMPMTFIITMFMLLPEVEDPCILISEALIFRNNIVQQFLVHGQVSQSCQQPAVTKFTLKL
jgi:hypothetical protein